jgi:hypothetical protein
MPVFLHCISKIGFKKAASIYIQVKIVLNFYLLVI